MTGVTEQKTGIAVNRKGDISDIDNMSGKGAQAEKWDITDIQG
jgi:hypothetical protein